MMLPRRSTILGGAALAAGAAAVPARAQLTIDMTRPTFEPVPIAIVDFAGDRVGADIANVVRNDLQNSGLFRSIPPSSFIQQDLNASAPPRFPDWRQIGAAGVVVGQVGQAGGNIKVDFRLWDVVVGNQAAGLSFTSQPANWRRLAHIIADAIYKRVTGEEGYFDTRIAYVAESGPGNARVKRIAIMDQDGANNRYITDGRTIAITPRFSPTLQEIVYMAYARGSQPAARLPAERRHRPPRASGQLPRHELRAALLARRHQGGDEHLGERPAATSTRWTCAAARCAGSPTRRPSTPRRATPTTARRSSSTPTAAAASSSTS